MTDDETPTTFIRMKPVRTHMIVKRLLEEVRDLNGSVTAACAELNISNRTWHRWINGSSTPDARSFFRLCQAARFALGFLVEPGRLDKIGLLTGYDAQPDEITYLGPVPANEGQQNEGQPQ